MIQEAKAAMMEGNTNSRIFTFLGCFCLFVVAPCVHANEAFVNWSGGTLNGDTENTQITMVSEVVEITFGKDNYSVDALFQFQNDADAVDVSVAFPTCQSGILFSDSPFSDKSSITAMKTWIDGEECSFIEARSTLKYYDATNKWTTLTDKKSIELLKKTAPRRSKSEYVVQLEEWKWFVKQVHFPANQQLSTRVQYKAEYGSQSDNLKPASYIYGSGKTWKGAIKSAKFIFRCDPGVWLHSFPFVSHPYSWRRNGEREYILEMTELEPKDTDVLGLDISFQDPPYLNDGIYNEEIIPLDEEVLSLCTGDDCAALATNIEKSELRLAENARANGENGRSDSELRSLKYQWQRRIERASLYAVKAKEKEYKYLIKSSMIGDE